MLAIVEAEMSTSLSAPRFSRSGASGALVSEYGTDAASLIVSLPESPHARYARHPWQALSGCGEFIESGQVGARLRWRAGKMPVSEAACSPGARPRRAPGRCAAAEVRHRRSPAGRRSRRAAPVAAAPWLGA